MERTVRPRLAAAALLLLLLAAGLVTRNSLAASAPDAPRAPASRATQGGEPTPTATPTPPATLQSPADGATLPQPVAPDRWMFEWEGPRCGHTLHLAGPGGRSFVSPSVMPAGAPPSQFAYVYTQTLPLPADALGPWFWHVEYDCSTYQGQSSTRTFFVADGGPTATPTPTTAATPTVTGGEPTPAPTATPGPVTLQAPDDSATLAQPVAPSRWEFEWEGPRCGSLLHLAGPGGRSFVSPSVSPVGPVPSQFGYVYTQTLPLPADALGPWFWHVEYDCPAFQGSSATRTFFVTGTGQTLTEIWYNPLLLR